jgi:site-specific DNA-methyltransferase (cytosine-N4-specific)
MVLGDPHRYRHITAPPFQCEFHTVGRSAMTSLRETTPPTVADLLVERLAARTVDDADYWNFAGNDKRSHGHALFPYPAMMVPQLQGALLDDLQAADPIVEWCYDPFGGSGTVLTECMRRGLSFVGGDLNPLAVLIMAVKARPLREQTLQAAVKRVLADVAGTRRTETVKFRGRDKWFTADAVRDLSRLNAAIRRQEGRPTRRFLWVCLAATVRLVSNSRMSTFKLHVYPDDVLEQRAVDAVDIFRRVACEAVTQMSEQYTELVDAERLARGRYAGDVRVRHADVLDRAGWSRGFKADVLMTSPPYGDNRTTVPYGQHSFLPLMWIERADIVAGDLEPLLGSPYRIDVASIGGRRVADLHASLDDLGRRSEAIASTRKALAGATGDGLHRFAAFCADLDRAIDALEGRLRPGAIQFWTLGNRRISGQVVPTSTIVSQLSASRGATELVILSRSFPKNSRRMAARNDTVQLMDTEQILVLRSPNRTPGDLATPNTAARRPVVPGGGQ